MAFSLPNLPFKYGELEPHIDEETMKTHHSKHHQTYINKLNKTVEDNGITNECLSSLILGIKNSKIYSHDIKESLVNNGGGHYNHSLFWHYISPSSSTKDIHPGLFKALEQTFDSFENFIKLFDSTALSLFGSGWVWLCYNKKNKKLTIEGSANQDNPMMYNTDLILILGLDVWEHAYYLKYKNNRPEYVSNWWKVVNWKFVSSVYVKCVIEEKSFILSPDGLVLFK